MDVSKEFQAEVEKLVLGPTDVLVVKSRDINTDFVQALRKKFNRQVIGLQPEDSVTALQVNFDDVIVVKGPNMMEMSVEMQADVEKVLKEKLGCKAVLFLGEAVDVDTLRGHCPRCSCES